MNSADIKSFAGDMTLLICYPDYVMKPIKDIAVALFHSFTEYGVDVDIQGIKDQGGLDRLASGGGYNYIISINTHDYLEQEHKMTLKKYPKTKIIAYNLEQSPIDTQGSYWATMRLSQVAAYGPYVDYIASESKCKHGAIRDLGLATLHLDIPYHPILDLGTNILSHSIEDKEYDVLFFGCQSERRNALLEDLKKEGVTFAPMPTNKGYDMAYKLEMVLKSRICLNVHFSNMEYFEKPRIMYDFFMNKGVVLSEKILYPEIFTPLKDLYMTKYQNLVPTVKLLLNKYSDEMLQVGESAYVKMRDWYAPHKVVEDFLRELFTKEIM